MGNERTGGFDEALGQRRGAGSRPLPVYRFLDVCVTHITRDEFDDIGLNLGGPGLLAVFRDERDQALWLSVPEDWETREEIRDDYPNVAAVLDLAHSQGCNWCHLDPDAETLPELPVHDWRIRR